MLHMLRADKLRELMNAHCDGNYNRFARELGVDTSQLHRFLNTGVGGGKKMVGAVFGYCKGKGLDFQEYINLAGF